MNCRELFARLGDALDRDIPNQTRAEFNQRASFIREGARVFQYNKTRTKNLAVSVYDLRPLSELLERAMESWSSISREDEGHQGEA